MPRLDPIAARHCESGFMGRPEPRECTRNPSRALVSFLPLLFSFLFAVVRLKAAREEFQEGWRESESYRGLKLSSL